MPNDIPTAVPVPVSDTPAQPTEATETQAAEPTTMEPAADEAPAEGPQPEPKKEEPNEPTPAEMIAQGVAQRGSRLQALQSEAYALGYQLEELRKTIEREGAEYNALRAALQLLEKAAG